MPKIDGIRLFRMLKKRKRYSKIPVLFISGRVNKDELGEEKWKILKRAEAYFEKSFRTKAFMETVKMLIEE